MEEKWLYFRAGRIYEDFGNCCASERKEYSRLESNYQLSNNDKDKICEILNGGAKEHYEFFWELVPNTDFVKFYAKEL